MTTTAERHSFQAEVTQLLDLLIHSLYSHKDVFLRELISNASDALDKRRVAALTDAAVGGEDLHIRIRPDGEARTLEVSDNGIGMDRDELIANIGTIARSGTAEFLRAMQEAKAGNADVDLIGQFGVGFYASFIVADRVSILTRRAGTEEAFRWESDGAGEYTIEPAERDTAGTTVTLHLRPVDEENGLRDYTQEWVIREIVKHHSDFVGYPIRMEVEQRDGGGDDAKTVTRDDTLNSMKAIWTRPASEVSDEEYKEFYKHITHDWTDPLRHLSVRMEGTVEARALLYLPTKAPFDLYHRETSYRGLQLYIKRVFIMDECQDLMPSHLRFVKGVVDSDDLTLNVSREMLQQDRQIRAIRKFLVRKVLDELGRMQREERATYRDFWTQFGPVIKEGLLSWEEKKEPLLDLMLCASTRDPSDLTTVADYLARMPQDQPAIYYLCGPTVDAARRAPQLEAAVSRGYEVLLFGDRVDEVWLQQAPEYQERSWQSVSQDDVALGSEQDREAAKEHLKTQAGALADLTKLFQEILAEDIKEVRVTDRLTDSPACLVSDAHDPSPQMIEALRHAGQDVPKVKRILELNPTHAIVDKLRERLGTDQRDPVVREYAVLLYGQALLAEGHAPEDRTAFSHKLVDALARGL